MASFVSDSEGVADRPPPTPAATALGPKIRGGEDGRGQDFYRQGLPRRKVPQPLRRPGVLRGAADPLYAGEGPLLPPAGRRGRQEWPPEEGAQEEG